MLCCIDERRRDLIQEFKETFGKYDEIDITYPLWHKMNYKYFPWQVPYIVQGSVRWHGIHGRINQFIDSDEQECCDNYQPCEPYNHCFNCCECEGCIEMARVGLCGSCNIKLDHFRDGTEEDGNRCHNCYWEEEGPCMRKKDVAELIYPDYRLN